MPLFYEWTRDYIKGMRLDAGRRARLDRGRVIDSIVIDNPMDMEFGPDGALYVLEYGDGYFAENPDAQLSRIDYIGAGGNRSPVPVVSADPDGGRDAADGVASPATARPTRTATGSATRGTSTPTATSTPTPEPDVHLHRTDGVYRATLKVTDVGGKAARRHASADVDIVVGNQAPDG